MNLSLRYIKNEIKEGIDYYLNYHSENSFAEVKIEENTFILTKHNIFLLLFDILTNKKDIDLLEEMVKSLIPQVESNFEKYKYNNILHYIKEFKFNQLYNIDELKNNKFLMFIQNRNCIIMREYKYFNGFKKNQNIFDNMLSIIKILERLKENNISNDYKLIFDSQKDNSLEIHEKMLEDSYKEFGTLRFIL